MKSASPSRNPLRARSWMAAILVATLWTGCQREEIRVYRVGKEKEAESLSVSSASMANGEAPRSAPPRATWKLPENWEEQPATAMRVGNFVVKGDKGEIAEVLIVPIPENPQNEAEVINIWRATLDKERISDAELHDLSEHVMINGAEGHLYDLGASSAQDGSATQIIGAVLPHEGFSWIFKLSGPASLVSQQKETFIKFLETVRFQTDAAPQVASQPPGRAATGNANNFAVSSAGLPEWKIPGNWHQQPPTAMLLASFQVTNGAGEARMTVSSFPGAVGGLLANVNRWRGEIGLAPVEEGDLTNLVSEADLHDGKAMLVDLSGDEAAGQGAKGAERTLAAMVPHGGNTWFFKLRGPKAVVTAEKDAFIQFLKSVRFPNVS